MTTVDVTIGWTISDMANGYSSFAGYKVGARQHAITVPVEVNSPPTHELVEQIAEAAFMATNHPNPRTLNGLAKHIFEAVKATGYNGREAHYSLSVGDTVTVAEVTMACESSGWRRVNHHA